MAKKKSKQQPLAAPEASADCASHSPDAAVNVSGQASTASAPKKSSQTQSGGAATSSSPSLVICRNKHWRHISSFHGAWLQVPVEILETVAHVNYNTQRPRPIDPAVFFDLVKIRKSVDEASDLAVRAASDTASSTLSFVNGGMPGVSSMNAFGLGGLTGHGIKLSRERRFRMRELASQKLARAYRLDEIASSVATMQGASTLEDIAALVLQHSPADPDAKYVHFFHQKIPSRQLAASTSLQPLEDIMSSRAGQPEVLRTLAAVKIFKGDLDGAAQDLTEAISLLRFHERSHRSSADSVQQAQQAQGGRRRPDVFLSEDEQPSGLESQLMLQRGCLYLSMAIHRIPDSLPCATAARPDADSFGKPATDDGGADGLGEQNQDSAPSVEASNLQADSQRYVKSMAKRALRDLMAFLAQLDYSPDMPIKINRDFNERVWLASQGARNPRCTDAGRSLEPHTVYSLAELFLAVPPSNLPAHPSQDIAGTDEPDRRSVTTCEWVTYHPLLTEALHSLLLSHCLAQTSIKEITRHAYMVARLVRLCEGYPLFQASRSSARTDWAEVLRKGADWLTLSSSWESLCYPAPLPVYDPHSQSASSAHNPARATAAAALVSGGSSVGSKGEKGKNVHVEPDHEERFPGDGHAGSESTSAEKNSTPHGKNPAGTGTAGRDSTSPPPLDDLESAVWWPSEDSGDCLDATDRSVRIVQWLLQVPHVTGVKRKKRAKRGAAKAGEAADGLAKLALDETYNA